MSYFDAVYLAQRMKRADRMGAPASIKFDLAASPLNDDELDEAIAAFDAPPQPEGWGLSSVFDELLSREPKRIPESDLTTLQQRLKEQGYLPPEYPVNGEWDAQASSAFDRFDRDNKEQVMAGARMDAGTIQDGITLLGNTLPVSVIQGIFGTARGLVEQTPETFARSGAIGGAGIGLGLAAAAAPLTGGLSLVGAGVAASIGALGGAIAGLFDDDDEDTNQSFMDILHPFNRGEWTTPKNFAEDLGFVASAASLVRGGRMAFGARLPPGGLRNAMTALGPVTKPGYTARLLGSAKGSFALGAVAGGATGVATGEDLGDVFTGAAIGGAAGAAFGRSPLSGKTKDLAAKYGLNRIATNPMLRTVNKAYTGLTVGSIGGRYFGGLGGEEDLFDPKTGKLAEDRPGTAIAEAIEEAPRLPDWVDYTLGAVVFPERFFPVSLGELGRGMRRMLGDTELYGWVHFAQRPDPVTGKVRNPQEAKEFILKTAFQDDPARMAYGERVYGINRKARQIAEDNVGPLDILPVGEREEALIAARAEIFKTLNSEGDEAAALNRELISYAHPDPLDDTKGPLAFGAHLISREGLGLGSADDLPKWFDSVLSSEKLTARARAGDLNFQEITVGGGGLGRLESGIAAAKARIDKLEAVAEPTATTLTKLTKDRARLGELQARRESLPQHVSFVAARQDTVTQKGYHDLADEYNRLTAENHRSFEAASKLEFTDNSPTALGIREASQHASERFNRFMDDLFKRELVSEGLRNKGMLPGKMGKDKDFAVSRYLRERAEVAVRDVEIDPADVHAMGLKTQIEEAGYKLVATGEDIPFLSDMSGRFELSGLSDYTKRAQIFETLALSPFKHTDDTIRPLLNAHEERELHQAMAEVGIAMNGRQAKRKIIDFLNEHNHGDGVVPGPGPLLSRIKDGKTKRAFYKVDDRQLSLDDIVATFNLNELDDPLAAAKIIKKAVHRGRAFGAEAHLKGNARSLLATNLRINGLQGFSDYIRTGSLDINKLAFGKSPFKVGDYGWLPNKLHNANMALRYALSFTFDAGRYMEQAAIAGAKYDLPIIMRHKKYIQRHYADEFGGNADQAWSAATEILDDAMGRKWMRTIDDIDRRMFSRGMLGFSPREADAAYAFLLAKRGMGKQEIKEAVLQLGRYGTGRVAIEKTANFVVFPFSFTKKYISTLGDWALQEPARALLIHEGFRRFHESSGDERFTEFFEKHVPLAEQIKRINTLSFGLSPGRFVLDGFTDNRTLLGKVSQALSSVFVPGGVATPVAQGSGKLGDLAVHMFSPVVVTGENIDSFVDIMDSYVPAVRDVRGFWESTSQQLTAVREGAAPYYQLRAYHDERRATTLEYEDLAESLGYATVDGFLSSPIGRSFAPEVAAKRAEIDDKYPTALRMSSEFNISSRLDAKGKRELAEDSNRSAGEDAILQLVEMDEEVVLMAETLGRSQDEMRKMFASDIRDTAAQFWDDRRFTELWERWFQPYYGPIRSVA